MSRVIPTTWDHVEPFILTSLRATLPAETVRNVKPKQNAPYRVVVIRGDLQQKVTPVSRYARVGIQAWVVNAGGEADFPAARDLWSAAADSLEALPVDGDPLISAERENGPLRVVDSQSDIEYAYGIVLLEVHAA